MLVLPTQDQQRFPRANQVARCIAILVCWIQALAQRQRQVRRRNRESKASAHQTTIKQDVGTRSDSMKEVSVFELLIRNLGRFAAGSGVVALLVWLTWVMLDVQHMQSGFTLPQSSY